MPPAPEQNKPTTDTSHMIPEHTLKKNRGGSGPIIGICIIVVLLIIGALYFWGAELNKTGAETLPLIPAESVNS